MALTKAKLIPEGTPEANAFKVLFNPSEYTISEGANYAEKSIPGLDGPISQFIAGTATTLSMTLICDTYKPPQPLTLYKEGGDDVSKTTKQIAELIRIKSDLHRPPKVTFKWGSLSFEGIITDLKQTFTMFLSDGKPVRAKLDITFKSYFDVVTSKKATPFESPDRTKFRTIHEGEQLWNFAYQEYGSPEMWRVIAIENGILNPLEVKPGQIIKLPAL